MLSKKSKIFVAGHNGMVGSAILRALKKKGYKKIITINKKKLNLLDQNKVRSFLKKMGMVQELRDHVFTSGEAALKYLDKHFSLKKFYHIGPPRDFDLFNSPILWKTSMPTCLYISRISTKTQFSLIKPSSPNFQKSRLRKNISLFTFMYIFISEKSFFSFNEYFINIRVVNNFR